MVLEKRYFSVTHGVKEKIAMEIEKYFELNDNKNMTWENLDSAKAILTGNLKYYLHMLEENKGSKLIS